MKITMANMILIITTIATALISGLFYAYSCSVNPGLGRLGNKEYLAAMQAINSAIQNPVFFITFMGTLFLLPLSAWQHYGQPRFVWLCAAAIIYIIGVFGVTVAGNVPLNEALDRFDLANALPGALAYQRKLFEAPWLYLHNIRTIAAVICLVLVVISGFVKTNEAA